MKPIFKTISYVTAFAIAMGFFEAAVVIYLREIYYNDGFSFPLRPMPLNIAAVEICREAATVIMLVAVGYLTGKTRLQRFAYFNLAFAVWDIFYYVFLYVFLGWPQSLSTWDILFLIPLPWVGPVWAPCLLSSLMIVGSLFVILQVNKDAGFNVKRRYWFLLITGALVCIFSFMLDFMLAVSASYGSIFSPQAVLSEARRYIPNSFNYVLFFTGFALMSYPVALHLLIKNKDRHEKE